MNDTHGIETIMANAASRAAELHIADRGITVDPGKLRDALKVELVEQWPALLDEWRNAIAAHMPAAMLRYILNVDANHIAVKAIARATKNENGQGLVGLIIALAALAIILVMAARAFNCQFDLSALTY